MMGQLQTLTVANAGKYIDTHLARTPLRACVYTVIVPTKAGHAWNAKMHGNVHKAYRTAMLVAVAV